MNRLTKHIALVLISSSLVLAGCGTAPEFEDEEEQQPLQTSGGTSDQTGAPGYAGASGYQGTPAYTGTSGYAGASGYHGGAPYHGGYVGGYHGVGISSYGGGHSARGGSVRGGFGGAGHAGG